MSDTEPTVSVVMPVYNAEPFLRRAVASILNQTWRDFEFIIVDDGSTDASPSILRSFQDPRIRLVFCEHAGFIPTLTRAVYEAQGDWIARMDADDISHPDRLKRQMQFLESHPDSTFIGTWWGWVTPNDKLVIPATSSSFEWRPIGRALITRGRKFADASVVFRRASALDVGLYDTDFTNELALWYKLLQAGKGAELAGHLYFNRVHSRSMSRQGSGERIYTDAKGVRARYDPDYSESDRFAIRCERDRLLSQTRTYVDLCLAADDTTAARDFAKEYWHRYPSSYEGVRLLMLAYLRIKSLRFWKRQKARAKYLRVELGGQ